MKLIRPFVISCLAGASLSTHAQTGPAAAAPAAAPTAAPAPQAAPAEMPIIDEIAVIVNNGMVTRKEVLERAAQVEEQFRASQRPVPERTQIIAEAMDQLVLERIQVQEATEADITVPDADLERIIRQIAQQNGIGVEALRTEVEKTGMKWPKYREQLRKEVQIGRLRYKEVVSKVQVYDNELDAFIAERTGRAALPAGDEYRIEQILVPVPEGASAERSSVARDRAAAMLKQIRDGAEFPKNAPSGSDLQVSDLGYRNAERLPKLFLDAVSGLKPGELIAAPLQSPAGWHILRLTDKRRAGMDAIKVPQTQIRQIVLRVGDGLNEAEARRRLYALAERVRNGGNFAELARQFSQDPPSAQRGGDLGWVSAGELPPEIEAVIRDLKPGEMAEPVRGQNSMHLIQAMGRREAEVTAEQQREFARAAIRERKVEQAVRDWLRQLRENAYVDYRVGRG